MYVCENLHPTNFQSTPHHMSEVALTSAGPCSPIASKVMEDNHDVSLMAGTNSIVTASMIARLSADHSATGLHWLATEPSLLSSTGMR